MFPVTRSRQTAIAWQHMNHAKAAEINFKGVFFLFFILQELKTFEPII